VVIFPILLDRVLILLQSFQKVQIGPQKKYFKKSNWVSKKAEFYAEHKTVGKNAKINAKKLYAKN